MRFSFGQANGVGRAFGWTAHNAFAYGLADGVGDAQGVAVRSIDQIMSLYGRWSGMMLQGSASRRV